MEDCFLSMTKRILIAGGSGLVGGYLSSYLEDRGHTVQILTRSPRKNRDVYWDPSQGELDIEAIKQTQVIIHLSGVGIVDKKWTENRKFELIASRVKPVQFLNDHLNAFEHLESIVGISGVNCYGMNDIERLYTEQDPYGQDFIDLVVKEWESAYQETAAKFINTTVYRMGVVFTPKGGALEKLVRPVRLSVGAALGNGKQNMPWIHIEDVCGAIHFAFENNVKGTFNLIAGNATNEQVTEAIAESLKKKLWLPNVPSILLKLIFGERSDLLLKGVPISNQKIKQQGYKFKFEGIQETVNDLLK